MKNTFIALVGLAVCLTIAASCNKTSLLGAELFENDKLNLQFTDTLSINTLIDPPAPVLMSIRGAAAYDNLTVGNMPDPTFGKTEATIYANFGIRGATQPTFPSLDTAIIDSVRLILPYYAAGFYGDTMATQKLVVYRLTEELKGDTIYSDKTFPTANTALGSLTFKPTPRTPIQRIVPPLTGAINSDTATFIPHISIPLDINLGRDIMKLDAASYKDTTLNGSGFHYWLKGLAIKAETPANCMMSFDMGQSAAIPTTQKGRYAGIYVYYRNKSTDTTRQVFTFYTTGQQRYSNYKNDFQNSKVKDFVKNPAKADSLIFLQSLGGAVARFEFPNLKNLGKVLVNKAELEFTLVDSDTSTFPALQQLMLLYGTAKIPNGNLANLGSPAVLSLIGTNAQAILDAKIGTTGYSATTFSTVEGFGGYPIVDKGVRKYKMAVTQLLQTVINGTEGTQIYLVPHFQYTKAGRVVLYGSKNSKYRAKLNLIYTKI